MGLEELRKSSNFVVICADLLYYKCYKISLKCGVLYMDSPNWIKKYKLIMFTLCRNISIKHKGNEKNSQSISKVELFIGTCNLEVINYPSERF